jgi:hypothetical protein
MAFLIVLDLMTPAERAFILHDVFRLLLRRTRRIRRNPPRSRPGTSAPMPGRSSGPATTDVLPGRSGPRRSGVDGGAVVLAAGGHGAESGAGLAGQLAGVVAGDR